MNLEAKYSREWLNRMGIILLLIAGSSGWFFYDGLVAYPKYNEGAAAYAQIVEMVKEEGLTDAAAERETAARWEKCAASFDADPQDPPKHAKDIDQQIQFGVGLAIFAAIFALWVLREMKRIIRANDDEFDGLTTTIPPFNGKTSVRFDSVFGIDKRKWKNKGIAVVHYKNKYDRPCRAMIDDYKYAGSEAILEKCEAVIAEKKAAKSAESDR